MEKEPKTDLGPISEPADPVDTFTRMWEKADELAKLECPDNIKAREERRGHYLRMMIALWDYGKGSECKNINIDIKGLERQVITPEPDPVGTVLTVLFGTLMILGVIALICMILGTLHF